jgi:hypothetical protein
MAAIRVFRIASISCPTPETRPSLDSAKPGLPVRYAADIARLQKWFEAHQMDDHPALRSVVREFLYDWKVILRPLAEPHLPLSNNAAEQALRHWVISRTINHGTRSEAGPPRPCSAG